jgi:uncharacterized protein
MDYSQVKNFLAFVEIDAEITELESDRRLVESEITKAENLISNYQSQISNNNLVLSNLNKKQHTLESEIKYFSSRESDKKYKLEHISNSREFLALNQELEDIVKKKNKLEAEYFNAWQELESLEKQFVDDNLKLEGTMAIEQKEIENFKRRLISIENRLKYLIEEKDKVMKLVDPELFAQYTSMKQSTKNPVVKVKRESCAGCFYMLSHQDLVSLNQSKLIRCKNCFRIIYNPEEPLE